MTRSKANSGEPSQTETLVYNRKQSALKFLELVIAGNLDDAFRKYVAIEGKHHNPFFLAGFPALRDAMKENHVQFLSKQHTVRNV